MPESLQSSPTGELLTERKERCEEVANELDSAADEMEGILDSDPEDDESEDDRLERAAQILDCVSWDF